MVYSKHHIWICTILIISLIFCSTSICFAQTPPSTIGGITDAFQLGATVAELYAMIKGWYGANPSSVNTSILLGLYQLFADIYCEDYCFDALTPYTNTSLVWKTHQSFLDAIAVIAENTAIGGYKSYQTYSYLTSYFPNWNSYLTNLSYLDDIFDRQLLIANQINSVYNAWNNDISSISDLNTIVSELNTIDWIDSTSQLIGVYDGPTSSANQITSYGTSLSYNDYYFRFTPISNTGADAVYRVVLPISCYNIANRNKFVDYVEVLYGNYIQLNSNIEYIYNASSTYVIIAFSNLPNSSSSYFQIHLHTNYNGNLRNNLTYIQYIPRDTIDNMLIKYELLLSNIHDDINDFQIDLSNSNITVDSNFDDSNIIDAINSLDKSHIDVDLNVNWTSDDSNDTSHILNK